MANMSVEKNKTKRASYLLLLLLFFFFFFAVSGKLLFKKNIPRDDFKMFLMIFV